MTDTITLEPKAAKARTKKARPDRFAATIPVGALHAALGTMAGVVHRRNTIPILGCVMLTAKGGKVTLTGTDLDNHLVIDLPAESVASGAICTDMRTLAKIIREADRDGSVAITHEEQRLAVSVSGIRYTLAIVSAEDFPSTPFDAGVAFAVDGSDFRRLFAKTAFAISTEETHYYLNGVYLHIADRTLRAVATDGHRLGRVGMDLPNGAEDMPGMIVPRSAVKIIMGIAKGGIRVEVSAEPKATLRLSGPGWTLTSKIIDGTFPDYTRVIPSNNNSMAVVGTDALRKAIKRVCAVSEERSRAVKMEWTGNNLDLSCNAPDSGQASTSMPVEWSSAPLTIGFNGRYLGDILGMLDGERVAIDFDDPSAPTVFRDPDDESTLTVLMPMRV